MPSLQNQSDKQNATLPTAQEDYATHSASVFHSSCATQWQHKHVGLLLTSLAAVPISCMKSSIVKGFLALHGRKRGGPSEMSADPLVLQPVGKVGCPVVTVQVCAGCDAPQQVLHAKETLLVV